MISGECIVCFAPDPWSDIWRNRHRLLSIFARKNRVLYVEPRMAARPLARKLWSGEIPPAHFFRPRLEEARDNLYVYHDPLHLPRTAWRGLGPLVDRLRAADLKKALRRLGFSSPILWLVRPESHDLPGTLNEKLVLYQIVDDYSGYAGLTPRAKARLEREEGLLARRADLVVVTSQYLLDLKRHLHPHVALVRNGVDDTTLKEGQRREGELPADLSSARRPIYGYLGGITDKLDLELLEKTAAFVNGQAGGSLALVGPVRVSPGKPSERIGRLRRTTNVIFTGQKPAAEVPSYLRSFDVGLIPYQTGDQALAIDPLKLYEYLAFGKPAVSVEIPSVALFKDVVRVGSTHEEFLRHLKEAAREQDVGLANRRRALARENSWESRAEQISSAIEERLEVLGLGLRPSGFFSH
jgi:glycosyltransferase involved in cell wall biosynthesis